MLVLAPTLLAACSPTQSHTAPSPYTGVNRVGTPLPGAPNSGGYVASINGSQAPSPFASEFDAPAATAERESPFSHASTERRQKFKNRVGEPIPGLSDLPPVNALTGTGPNAIDLAVLGGVEIGLSRNGTPIHAIEYGPALGMGPPAAQRVYLIGLIHGDEDEGYGAIREVLAELQRHAGPDLSIRVVPTMNPDGQTVGRRGNAGGVDLNRNWPASNFSASRTRGESPASEPEVAAVLRDVRTFAPNLLIVFHSISTDGPFVNFDGPASTRDAARAFADAATLAGGGHWTVKASMGYETPGSLGTWAGVDGQIPTLTVEFRAGQRPAEVSRAAVSGVRAAVQAATTR